VSDDLRTKRSIKTMPNLWLHKSRAKRVPTSCGVIATRSVSVAEESLDLLRNPVKSLITIDARRNSPSLMACIQRTRRPLFEPPFARPQFSLICHVCSRVFVVDGFNQIGRGLFEVEPVANPVAMMSDIVCGLCSWCSRGNFFGHAMGSLLAHRCESSS
jgi:hypothetical protein